MVKILNTKKEKKKGKKDLKKMSEKQKQMYNLKCCGDILIDTLMKNGFKAAFTGEYPWQKCYNATHQSTRLDAEEVELVTNATLDDLKEIFKVVEVKNDYVKCCIIETVMKQNTILYKIYYKDDYVSKVDGSVEKIKSFEDILRHRIFLHESITIDSTGKMYNFPGKLDAYKDVNNQVFSTILDVDTAFKKDPLSMLKFIKKFASYKLFKPLPEQLKALNDNYKLLTYEHFGDIIEVVNDIISAKMPQIGLVMIETSMLDLTFGKNNQVFEFIKYIKKSTLKDLRKIERFDLISRWAFILKDVPEDIRLKTIRTFKLDATRINWLIKYYELPLLPESEYKQALYDAKEDLKVIKDRRCGVFVLYAMVCKLNMIYNSIDPDNAKKYDRMLDIICARPMYIQQIYYEDEDICKLLDLSFENIEKDWFTQYKEDIIYKVLMSDVHPSDEEYLEIMYDIFNSKYKDLEDIIPKPEGYQYPTTIRIDIDDFSDVEQIDTSVTEDNSKDNDILY